ncbi:MAG: hypothetical protein RL199_1780, partial [Pseudomonadota bacterium]
MTDLGERHATTSPLERFECRLVRHAVEQPGSIHPRDEATLRYALALGRLGPCRLADGTDLDLAPHVAELRDRALAWLSPALAGTKVDAVELARSVPALAQAARMARSRIFVRYGQQLSAERLEKELCQRALVLACGGGGGVGYGHLGVFALLESAGLRPALIAGSSMGSVLGLFRARALRFEVAQVPRILGEVETRRLFRPFSTESRWTIPSAIRLALREGIGPYF